MGKLETSWSIGEQSRKRLPRFGAKAPPSTGLAEDRPRLIQTSVAKLTRLPVPADLDIYPPSWTAADRHAFEQRWSVRDWDSCPRCGFILVACDCQPANTELEILHANR